MVLNYSTHMFMAQPLIETYNNYNYKILFENDIFSIFPELFLSIASVSLLIYGVIYTTTRRHNYPTLVKETCWLASIAFFFTILLIVKNPILHGTVFYNTILLDDYTLFFKLIVVSSALVTILISIDYLAQESLNNFEYIILITISTVGIMFLISSADLISLYLAIELQSLCFYVLAAGKRNSEFSTEAGLKYFLLGAFSSGLLLFGSSLIYGFTGMTNFLEIANLLHTYSDIEGGSDLSNISRGCQLGMIFILVGLLFKLTAAPFHMWAPDVYEGAPTAVTAFFAITPKAGIFAVVIRLFLHTFYDFLIPWQTVLIFCSLTSMIIGSLAALSQNKMKRLLAYSSIGHVGYMLVGLSCGTIEGLQGLLIYLVIYIAMTINMFGIILYPLRRENVHAVQRVKYITDLASLSKINPIIAITLTIGLFSMAGIPPLAGFYSKAFIFFAAMNSSLYLLAFVGVITSVISCFYYIRIIKIMYFQPGKVERRLGSSFFVLPKHSSLVVGASFLFIAILIAYPSPLYLVTHKIALALSI